MTHNLTRHIKNLLPCKERLSRLYHQYKGRERRVSYGKENPDKVFYVTGQDDLGGGLFWLVNKVVMHLAYAKDKGYITVVDYQNHLTQYTRPDSAGKTNVWELFFRQPMGYTLDDIRHSRHIVINKMEPSPKPEYLMGQYEFYDRPERLEYFRNIFQEYIRFNERTQAHLEQQRERLLGDRRTVGVLCRGTDYVLLKPEGHPVQPEPEDVVADVRKVMQRYDCQQVFLATEDQDILDLFKQSFPKRLAYLEQMRLSKRQMSGKQVLSLEKMKRADRDPYDDALQYLTAVYLLSRCNCFVAGRTGGTKGVLLMAHPFEYQKIYDLGLYKHT